MINIKPSEITPVHVYLSRRKFMVGIGALALGSLVASACGTTATLSEQASEEATPTLQADRNTDELGDSPTSFEAITNYNNFYEFSVDKQAVAGLAPERNLLLIKGSVPGSEGIDVLVRPAVKS